MNFVRLCLLILLALSPVPHLAALVTEMNDYRVEYVLHAMPAETQLVSVVSAPNIVFDQPVFQLPDPETCLQLSAVQCFWDVKNEIHQSDVLLCVYCTLEPNQQASIESKYPTCHFVFLTSNPARDKEIENQLQDNAVCDYSERNNTVYQLSDSQFVCMPRGGLILCTNDRTLMRTVLSRLNAWWLTRVAMPSTMIEWNYVNQKSPYWGIRHFPPNDGTSPSGSMPDNVPIGLTFEYTNNSSPLNMTYLAKHGDRPGAVASMLIKDIDPWTEKHISVQSLDRCATRLIVSDSRCLSLAAYSALEWFDPPFAIRVARIRQHRK